MQNYFTILISPYKKIFKKIFFFSICQKWQLTIIKNKNKSFEKKHAKNIKLFLKKKKKDEERSETDIKIFLK